MSTDLLQLVAHGERDVFTVRQRGREVAAALGLDQPAQVRLATALSEVCRLLLPAARTTTVTFRLADPGIEVTLDAMGPPPDRLDQGVEAARRLMDTVQVTVGDDPEPRTTVVLGRRLSPAPAPGADEIARVRMELSAVAPHDVLDELGVQNQHLIAALEQVQAQRDELLRLNEELEETNRGVVALYNQLSDELEETNRGVVALYAELDERSAQLREANEAKSRFLRNVSHELRAPVTAVMGMVRLLLDPGSDPLTGDQTHQLQLVQTSAQDLLSMVNELLDLAKAESNRLEPTWGAVDLRAVFSQLRGTLRHLARPTVDLVVDDPAGVPVLVTDEVMLVQILRNLLTNGLKFTERGEVRLTAEYSGDTVVLAVTDTGVGIAPDEQERVFEEFYQVRGAQQGTSRGTGLGLPYARRLAVLLGATLTLTSTPGSGSTFTVTLPRTPAGVDIETVTARSAYPRRLDTVLVVDDDAAFRHRLRLILEAEGLTVTEAGDGRAALDALETDVPDAILLDLRMPVMGGLELLGALAADDRLKDVPALVVTAAELDDVARAAVAHAFGVLDKATLTDRQVTDSLRAAAGLS